MIKNLSSEVWQFSLNHGSTTYWEYKLNLFLDLSGLQFPNLKKRAIMLFTFKEEYGD